MAYGLEFSPFCGYRLNRPKAEQYLAARFLGGFSLHHRPHWFRATVERGVYTNNPMMSVMAIFRQLRTRLVC